MLPQLEEELTAVKNELAGLQMRQSFLGRIGRVGEFRQARAQLGPGEVDLRTGVAMVIAHAARVGPETFKASLKECVLSG